MPEASGTIAGFDALDHAILQRLQGGFPLHPQPFAVAAVAIGTTETALLDRLRQRLADGTLTRFGPLYQIERMGGAFCLAALTAPPDDFDRVAAIVNAFPEVAHNYQRSHRLNMWFVLATETPAGIADAAARIEAATGLRVLLFPKEVEYFVGMQLAIHPTLGTAGALAEPWERLAAPPPVPPPPPRGLEPARGETLSAHERAVVVATQAGLPLVAAPYAAVAERLGWQEAEVIAALTALLARGVIRRIGAVPNHYRLGYRANGMTVWDVDDAAVDTLGPLVGSLPFVTHCYRRPRARPDWPYNLFAMVHGASRDEAAEWVHRIRSVLGNTVHGGEVLFSERILKKTGLRLA